MEKSFPYQPAKNTRVETDLYSRWGEPIFITIRASTNNAPFQKLDLCKMAINALLETQVNLDCQIHVY
jgi:hypothetical protein